MPAAAVDGVQLTPAQQTAYRELKAMADEETVQQRGALEQQRLLLGGHNADMENLHGQLAQMEDQAAALEAGIAQVRCRPGGARSGTPGQHALVAQQCAAAEHCDCCVLLAFAGV